MRAAVPEHCAVLCDGEVLTVADNTSILTLAGRQGEAFRVLDRSQRASNTRKLSTASLGGGAQHLASAGGACQARSSAGVSTSCGCRLLSIPRAGARSGLTVLLTRRKACSAGAGAGASARADARASASASAAS